MLLEECKLKLLTNNESSVEQFKKLNTAFHTILRFVDMNLDNINATRAHTYVYLRLSCFYRHVDTYLHIPTDL